MPRSKGQRNFTAEGESVGTREGVELGIQLGTSEGSAVGRTDGAKVVGSTVGDRVGPGVLYPFSPMIRTARISDFEGLRARPLQPALHMCGAGTYTCCKAPTHVASCACAKRSEPL